MHISARYWLQKWTQKPLTQLLLLILSILIKTQKERSIMQFHMFSTHYLNNYFSTFLNAIDPFLLRFCCIPVFVIGKWFDAIINSMSELVNKWSKLNVTKFCVNNAMYQPSSIKHLVTIVKTCMITRLYQLCFLEDV